MSFPYTDHDIFLIKWRKTKKYTSFSLKKVQLEYRIYIRNGKYVTFERFRDEKPKELGRHPSLREAQFRVYDQIIFFKLYQEGFWNPRGILR